MRVIQILYVMHVSSAITPGCLFVLHCRILLGPLILFIVIYGPRLFLVSLVTNTILSFLMILPIICGLFHYVLNLALSQLCPISSHMCPHRSAPPSRTSNAITGMSLKIHALGPSSPTACSCGCCVPTLLHKIAKLSASSVPLTM
jgi:hypothetical protein